VSTLTHRVGVDVGGTKVLGVVVEEADATLTVTAEHRVPTPTGPVAVLDAIAEVVRALDRQVPTPVASVGVGIAGLVDVKGILRFSPNLPTLTDVAVPQELEGRLGVPIHVDNDANCAAWGEHQIGAGRGMPHMVCVALGTGIGAGLVIDGKLVRGGLGFAGEAGHMIVDPEGPLCPCGRRGCWEQLASGTGLGRMARDAARAGRLDRALELAGGQVGAVRGEHVGDAAQEGDPQALELLRSFAWWVAVGIANLVTLLDSTTVVVGGGLVEIGEPLLGPVREHYRGLVMANDQRPELRIVPAELGERAAAVGATLLGNPAHH
jgi:glucokinase